jgi:peptidoglycan/LPS O-acetylase OafA/YrhL
MSGDSVTIENPPAAPPRRTVYLVQVMRGLAAAAVAIYHTHLILGQPQYGGQKVFETVATRGWAGVNFFFVLSGFIILLAHHRDIGAPSQVRRYAWRRFVRVYPIYWIFTTLYIVAALLGIGYPDFRWTGINLLSSYLLVPFEALPSPPLSVAWTLFYEVLFYALFVGLILNRKLGLALFALWTLAILFNSLVLGRTAMGPFSMWNIYFVIGMGAYLVYRHADGRWGWPLLLAGVLAIGAAASAGLVPSRISQGQEQPWTLLMLGFAFALLIAGASIIERERTLPVPKWLLLLGDASFTIYLTHSPALSLLAGLNQGFLPGVLPDWVAFIAAAILSLVAGVVAHLIIERPLLDAVHLRVGRLNRAGAERAPSA